MLMVEDKLTGKLSKFNPLDIYGDLEFIGCDSKDIAKQIVIEIEETDEVILNETELEDIVGKKLAEIDFELAKSYIIYKFVTARNKSHEIENDDDKKEEPKKEKKHKLNLFKR